MSGEEEYFQGRKKRSRSRIFTTMARYLGKNKTHV